MSLEIAASPGVGAQSGGHCRPVGIVGFGRRTPERGSTCRILDLFRHSLVQKLTLPLFTFQTASQWKSEGSVFLENWELSLQGEWEM